MEADSTKRLETRIRVLLCLFILGLVAAGVTAIPLVSEIKWLAKVCGADSGVSNPSWLQVWLSKVQTGVVSSDAQYPFLSYGTDWLAFGHFVIAVAFWGPLKDPVRNVWVVEFGMIASALVVPFAFVMGPQRGIPLGWSLIDCSFGVAGFVALAVCRSWIRRLEAGLRPEG